MQHTKVKVTEFYRSVGEGDVLIFLSWAFGPVGGFTNKVCDAWLVQRLPGFRGSSPFHMLWGCLSNYSAWWKKHVRATARWVRAEAGTSRAQARRSNCQAPSICPSRLWCPFVRCVCQGRPSYKRNEARCFIEILGGGGGGVKIPDQPVNTRHLVGWLSGKSWTFFAIRCHILKLKCVQFDLWRLFVRLLGAEFDTNYYRPHWATRGIETVPKTSTERS